MYDIAIIGAGPAGATLGRLLASRFRVLILEQRPVSGDPSPRAEKCCGGLVAPDAQRALAALGLGLPRDVLVGPQLFAVRTLDFRLGLEQYYQRHYINVDRLRFDNWLRSLVCRDAVMRSDCRVSSIRSTDGGCEVDMLVDGTKCTEHARIVVGADGAGSTVRRFCADGPPEACYMSLQEWYEVDQAAPYFGGIFDEEITDFYSWTIPKENLLVLGTAVPNGVNPSERFAILKKKVQAAGIGLGECVRRHGAPLNRPMRPADICLGTGNIALIGEAAGWISPSSAEGLSYAFRSALALSRALSEGLDDWMPRYRRLTAGLRRNILVKGIKSRLLFHPLFRRVVMQSGFRAIDRQQSARKVRRDVNGDSMSS